MVSPFPSRKSGPPSHTAPNRLHKRPAQQRVQPVHMYCISGLTLQSLDRNHRITTGGSAKDGCLYDKLRGELVSSPLLTLPRRKIGAPCSGANNTAHAQMLQVLQFSILYNTASTYCLKSLRPTSLASKVSRERERARLKPHHHTSNLLWVSWPVKSSQNEVHM